MTFAELRTVRLLLRPMRTGDAVPGKGSPEPMYLARGFVPTGEIDHGEIVARLQLVGFGS